MKITNLTKFAGIILYKYVTPSAFIQFARNWSTSCW